MGGEYLDKYEFSMKLDELKRLAANGQFRKAGKVLETIEVKKVKSVKELYVIVDILIENEKYEQAKDILIGISKKLKSRRVYHQIIDVCIKAGQVDSAKKYMKDFRKLAPKDPYNYVFQYQVAQLAKEPMEHQIAILEELKQYEYMEKWAYELAKAYYRAGRDSECVAECNDLILWFGDGVYVEKAKLLSQYLTEPSAPQQILKKVKEEVVKEDIKEETIQPPEEEESPSYQSAFDFIKDMETSQQEKSQEYDQSFVESPKETKKAIKRHEDIEYTMPNEREVIQLVVDTQDCLAAQIDDLFFDESKEIAPDLEKENSNLILEESEKQSEESEVNPNKEVLAEQEEAAATKEYQEVMEQTLSQDSFQNGMEEIKIENEDLEQQKVKEREERIQSALLEVEARTKKQENVQSKETVIEDVDRLIHDRRQRATMKKLNSFIKEILGEEVQITDYIGQFAKISSIGEDLMRSLETITATHNNSVVICVCGQSTDVQSYFSRKVAKLLSEMKVISSQAFVMLGPDKLEDLDLERCKEQLEGGCIVVEGVQKVTEQLCRKISFLIKNQCQIVLEFQQEAEESTTMQELKYRIQHEAESALANMAKVETILLESFEEEDYLGFAKDYLSEKEYSLEPTAQEYFLTKIKEFIEQKDIDVFRKVMDEITKAYHCANQRNKVELRNIAESGNYQDAVFMSIQIADFVNEN